MKLKYESEEWSSQSIFQFKQLERRSLEKSGFQRDSNPWPPRYRCDALPTELWSQTLGARSIYWVHFFREEWLNVKYIWNNSYFSSNISSTTAVQIWIISYILHIEIWICFMSAHRCVRLLKIAYDLAIASCKGATGKIIRPYANWSKGTCWWHTMKLKCFRLILFDVPTYSLAGTWAAEQI